jgi:AcrR family transcriptional regulator
VPERHPTSRRLIDEGLRLFVANGAAATPITEIERAAGLAPGSGAFYKHFRSKADLLAAAIEDVAATSATGAEIFGLLEGWTVADQARVIARGTWSVFGAHRDLILVLTKDVAHRPDNYSTEPDGWPGDGPAFATSWLTRQIENGSIVVADPRATALVLLDALTAYWTQRETEGSEPYGVDDDRFVDAWVELVLGLTR